MIYENILERRRNKIFNAGRQARGSFICKPTEDNYSLCGSIGAKREIILSEGEERENDEERKRKGTMIVVMNLRQLVRLDGSLTRFSKGDGRFA